MWPTILLRDLVPGHLQVANYREFAEARAAQLGRTFDDLLNPQRRASVSGQALLCTLRRADSELMYRPCQKGRTVLHLSSASCYLCGAAPGKQRSCRRS